jgi:hypothetical protein
MKNYVLGALASVAFVVPAHAQTAAPIAPIAAPGAAVLRTGTAVPLKMSESITTKGKKLKVGQRVHLEVAEDVKVNGVTVIPIGSPAIAEVTDVRNKGMWGKSGRIGAQVLYVTVNGRQIRMSGQFDDKGVTGTAGVVAAAVFIPVVGFFTTGTSAHIDLGSPVKAFVDEDVALNFTGSATPAAMEVAAPPAAK